MSGAPRHTIDPPVTKDTSRRPFLWEFVTLEPARSLLSLLYRYKGLLAFGYAATSVLTRGSVTRSPGRVRRC